MKQKRVIDSRFGERLRELRKERCLTMEQLCEQFNRQFSAKLSKCTISRYENSTQEPMLNTVDLLAKFFGVSPVYLMGQTDHRQAPTAANISNSAVVQGNNATTLIVRNAAGGARELSEEESELLRIYESLDVKSRTALMSYAFDLEEKQNRRK